MTLLQIKLPLDALWAKNGTSMGLNRNIALIFILAFLLFGCTTYPVRNDLSTECTGDKCGYIRGNGYSLVHIEFRDTGLFAVPEQKKNLFNLLNVQDDLLVILFVHGLEGSSRPEEGSLVQFENTLKSIAIDRPSDTRVIGIYSSWRGQSWAIDGLSALTFGARRSAAHRIGQRQFFELFIELSSVWKVRNQAGSKSSMDLVVIGHSLGGALVFESISREVIRRTLALNNSETIDQDCVQIPSLADRIILINPAISADSYAPLYFGIKSRAGCPAPNQQPLFEIYSSTDDKVVNRWFSFFRKAETLTFDPEQEKKLLTTPVSRYDDFATHKLYKLSCNQDDLVKLNTNSLFPVNVVRVIDVDGFQGHSEIWRFINSCLQIVKH